MTKYICRRIRRQPRPKRTDTLCPYKTLCRSRRVSTLSRERVKDMAGDYKPEQAFAELRGISFRERIMEIARQLPERTKSIFGNLRPQARTPAPLPARSHQHNEQRRAVNSYARALGEIGTRPTQGWPALQHPETPTGTDRQRTPGRER